MKSSLTITTVVLTTILALLQGCSYDKELVVTTAACDTLNVSFAADVQPLIQANCFSCHGNGTSFGNISLNTYDDVKRAAITGRLLGSVSHSAGFSPMPKAANKLPDCNIQAIRTWINEGIKDN